MILKRIIVALTLSLSLFATLYAQSTMTDNQVMQFMVKENARGTSRAEIVTKLMERVVQIDQIRRIRDKYE